MSLREPEPNRTCANGDGRGVSHGHSYCGDCLRAKARECPKDCQHCIAELPAALRFESLGPVLGDE